MRIEYDVVRVCQAIAVAETGAGRTAVGNNHHGMREFWMEGGVRHSRFMTFKTPEESYRYCEAVWDNAYGRLPTWEDARRWVGHVPTDWYRNFYTAYLTD